MSKSGIFAALLAMSATCAFAEGGYIGVSLGSASMDDLKSAANTNNTYWLSQGASLSRSTYTKGVGTSKIFGGFRLGPNFAIEGGFANLGEHTLDTTASGGGLVVTEAFKWDASALFVDAVGVFDLSDTFSLFGKLGYASAETESTYRYSDNLGGRASGTWTDSAGTMKYGFGATYEATKNLGIRLEYEMYSGVPYRNVFNRIDEIDVSSVSVGLTYKF